MKHFFLLTALALFCFACEQEDYAFGDITAPQNLSVEATITGQTDDAPFGDGSGQVVFTAVADNAITYRYVFSDGSEEIAPSGRLTKRFSQVGVNTYGVTIVASGTAGVSTTLTTEVTVQSSFSDPEVVDFLTGEGSKTWYWAADEPGHLGVGQNDDNSELNFYANYYQAAPFEKDGGPESACLYQDELIFTREGDALFFQLNNFGQTYFNTAYQGVAGGSQGFDFCYDFDVDATPQLVQLAPSESVVVDNGVPGQTRGTNLVFTQGGFMSYYIGATTYEIISVTDSRLVVRAEQGDNPGLAWYHIFSSTKPTEGSDDTDYDNLVWADEFNTDGAPDPAKWGYNIGRGDNGWGNGESQYYTDRSENVRVEDGVLKITAKKENFSGAEYTSARLLTENKFEFTYGRIDIHAKLPTGGGTWPALWMLGEDYATNTWPGCGEIDIMEHVGNRQDELFSTLHFPGNSGGNGVSRGTNVPGISTEFHTFSAIWSPESIRFFVDDELYHTFANDGSLPFNSDFFLIFNVAMGGGFGGNIAPDFVESTMEVDWVRVYQ
ncbi:family 16 glycosylhydrolase [Neolewinella aurantiaca]|uniref:Family 16 glycosylhydrolase n=1 Tax=Neolewinella aurantiaca TaxID=2602767 RepID=A0A5C7FNB1_9BACT|nr:family 16 glycosylhydrolase [Neolewinella aurantiaca]TXF86265.1 family 16 glycosylhydrolase [Neolewinella aurantiaca]